MKTPIQKIYLEKLVNLNDQFCFFLFNREELRQKLSNYSSAANPLFTTDLFSNNLYAKKIHVTFEKLPDFQEQNQTLNFGAYFSFSYEFLAGYIDDLILIIETINKVNLSTNEQKKEPEKRIKRIIELCGVTPPNQELFDTVSYFRLRRNYFTHVLDTLNNKFLDIVNNKGTLLNSFWSTARTDLDFTLQNVDEFEEIETIDCLKIMRILLETIDGFVGGILDKNGIAEYVVKEQYESNPSRINEDVVKQRKARVSSISQQQFGYRLNDSEMDFAVRNIGKR